MIHELCRGRSLIFSDLSALSLLSYCIDTEFLNVDKVIALSMSRNVLRLLEKIFMEFKGSAQIPIVGVQRYACLTI